MTKRNTNPEARPGHLVIIGGAEDKEEDKKILQRFVDLCGGAKAKIAVMTAASSVPAEVWSVYDGAFKALGVKGHFHVDLKTRHDGNKPELVSGVLQADGIFMTGGDQKKLLATIGGTAIDTAMHQAYRRRGAVIGGTSAGASAMSGHMLAESVRDNLPIKGGVYLGAGLGFLQRVIVDQHFSERQRLGRLLAVVAQNPYLFGIGIDENTALVVEHGVSFEVIGEGAVTVVDGRDMSSNYDKVERSERLELVNMKLHMFPTGSRYDVDDSKRPDDDPVSPLLQELIHILTNKDSASS